MKLEDVQRDALQLPDAERAVLAAELIGSLPAVLWDEDGGIAEAQRRSTDLASDPSAIRSWSEIRANLGR